VSVFQSTIVTLLIAGATTLLGAAPSALVYPSGPTVPENLLRVEVCFSAPIWPPLRMDDVKLTDAAGLEIKDPFLDLALPDSDGKSVIILFHPARVKTGVGANLALGRALHAGATITLTIQHPALKELVQKSWQVTRFDAQSPRPDLWTFERPQLGTRSPLVLHLDKPISRSAERLIAIRKTDGNRLAGEGHLENGETVWRFVPGRPWQSGNYAVVTHPDLEDAAGNRPSATFETGVASLIYDRAGTVQPFQLEK
jgi:hypothetical protein